MPGRIPLPDVCEPGKHEPAIVSRTGWPGAPSPKIANVCGKCGREIFRLVENPVSVSDPGDPWLTENQERDEIATASQQLYGFTQRVYGFTDCLGCNRRVAVVYPYSNSDKSIGIVDHEISPGKRCDHAGLAIWSEDLGWTEALFRDRYGPESIQKREGK